jgi:hypothetical protein
MAFSLRQTCLVVLLATLVSIQSVLTIGCSSAPNRVQDYRPQSKSPSAVMVPGWHKVAAGPFSILAPSGWAFHQLPGVDSYVGEYVGDGVVLRFDFGEYSSGYLKKFKKPAYVIAHQSIGGFPATIASSTTPGHGVTGVYFRNVGQSNGLFLWGKDLTSAQQELVLKIFETIQFGGSVPRYVIPPPPPTSQVTPIFFREIKLKLSDKRACRAIRFRRRRNLSEVVDKEDGARNLFLLGDEAVPSLTEFLSDPLVRFAR